MAESDHRELARRFFEDFCTKRQRELAAELMTDDFVGHDPQVPGMNGPEGMANAIATFQNGVEGVWNIEEILLAENDRVVVRWTGTGTHVAEVMGIPATGKAVRVAAISIFRVANGKFAEMWETWDTLGFLQQLGVIPPSG